MVADIDQSEGRSPDELTTAGDLVYFVIWDDANGQELWKSDGTEAGTVMVKDSAPGPASSFPTSIAALGRTVYFQAQDGELGAHGQELWMSNGTEAGTRMVKDIFPGPDSSQPHDFQAAGRFMFLVADDGVHGKELWQTDGTPGGTKMVRDIAPAAGSKPEGLADAGPRLFFSAFNAAIGREIWSTAGTRSVTRSIDLDPSGSSRPALYTRVGTTLYFSAYRPDVGRELWSLPL
jgi:ELWxxDGT repeat protein